MSTAPGAHRRAWPTTAVRSPSARRPTSCSSTPTARSRVDRDASQSLSRNTPWHGQALTGAVHTTILRGRVTARGGEPTAC